MRNPVKGILFLFLCLFLSGISFSQNYWLRQVSPTGQELKRCIFVDSLNGWAVGDTSTIIHTSNGGLSWTVQTSGNSSFPINEIFFSSRFSGWALCNDYSTLGTIIFKTTNGGDAWTSSRFYDTNVYVQSVFFADSLTGYLGTLNSRMFKTTNGGLNWNRCTVDTSSCFGLPIWKIRFLNSQTGFASGGGFDINGQIWKTTNAGALWQIYCLASEPLFDIVFKNGNIMACGGDFEFGSLIARSTNNGDNWNLHLDGCFGIAQYIAFRTPAEIWMPLGFSGFWAVATDSGNGGVWQCLPVPDTCSINACQFTTATSGWAFGTHGSIYKYNPQVIGITSNGNNVPKTFALFQNYPNPFNPSTKIKFSIPLLRGVDGEASRGVSLVVYDALGREVATLINEKLNPGNYSVEWDASNYPSGVYFYKLSVNPSDRLERSDGYAISKKMVLIK